MAGITCSLQAQKIGVHTIGDSTMADYAENTTRTRGWGEMFQEFFVSDATIYNYARGGRSSRSFYQEGLWDKVKEGLKPGDYVLIQFAHNDEKEKGKDGADGRGTAPWTTYKSYLEKYVDETRTLGGEPVFITPIIRRYFQKDGTISPKGCHDLSTAPDDSTLNYVRVMKHVAREKKVPLVDMTSITKDFSEQLGKEVTTKEIYVPTDGTHTTATGAANYAKLAAKGLKERGILSNYIKDNVQLVVNPTHIDFQTMYCGDESTICFDVIGLQLHPKEGSVHIKVPQGMTLTDIPQDTVGYSSMELPYINGKLWGKSFYLKFNPHTAGEINDSIVISYGTSYRSLPVYANCKTVSSRTPLTLRPTGTSIKGIIKEGEKYNIEGNKWPADIDEAANRYVEFILHNENETLNVKQLNLILEGDICYRIAYARGKDFYPRTDLGEAQRPISGAQQLTLPVNTTLKPGEQLNVRIFPWSLKETENLNFKIKDCNFQTLIIK
ncbi:rhamnogalacturonan acetylesterase [uncultured Bacteroides sp.]|uniref:rhamnogalacturonan acetylesterase n=1 Tax=uncultured Bacteroides sp. TaxID=162156 RepID=UPI00263864CE|nr:rhamnogalacturonan acetylesterase [uncultured Bacteroides sp.]